MKTVAYFPTFKRKFFFSQSKQGKILLKQFYQPYSFFTSLFCLIWEFTPFLSSLFSTEIENLPLNFNTIQAILGWQNIDFVLSGGAGSERKLTGLFVNAVTGEKVFFKYATSVLAIKLLQNEVNILSTLSLPTFPILLNNGIQINKDEWFVSSVFEGCKYKNAIMTRGIIELILQINKVPSTLCENSNKELTYAFSHGDFCPWNLVINQKSEIKIIDWEMAGPNLLGYDLFSFIFQSSFLLSPYKNPAILLHENINWFTYYFNAKQILDYRPYLLAFARLKLKKEIIKNNKVLIRNYQKLIKLISV